MLNINYLQLTYAVIFLHFDRQNVIKLRLLDKYNYH
jgi:hypothetical protein